MKLAGKVTIGLTATIVAVMASCVLYLNQQKAYLYEANLDSSRGFEVSRAIQEMWRRQGPAATRDFLAQIADLFDNIDVRWVDLDAPRGHLDHAEVSAADRAALVAGAVVTELDTGRSSTPRRISYVPLAAGGRQVLEVTRTLTREASFVHAIQMGILAATIGVVLVTLAALSAIALQNRTLRNLASSLEKRVRDRTIELEHSNSDLGQAYEGLRAAQRQLLQTEKMASLGLLVAGVAHEINNPVSFIVGNLGPLRDKLDALEAAAQRHADAELIALVDRIRRMLDTIGRGVERTAAIVQDLRTFSRVGDAARTPCDVHESLEISLRLLQAKWQHRVAIERDYAELPLIEAVPGQLNQVFINLLANACDAIADSGVVRIETQRAGDRVRISIRDDGSGIAGSDLDRLFDPFYTTKPQGKGTGLGLSITHGIVEDHAGRIDVESEVGTGTTFTIWLPIKAARSSVTEAREP
jgi:signal transduction histidine kinase